MLRRVIISPHSSEALTRALRRRSCQLPSVTCFDGCNLGRHPIESHPHLQSYCTRSLIYMAAEHHQRFMSTDTSLNTLLSESPKPEHQPELISVSKEASTSDEFIPTNRSKHRAHKLPPLFDPRAEAKLAALTTAKENANLSRAKYQTRLKNVSSPNDEYLLHLKERVIETQQELGVAYSQAIKYCSRIMNNPDATVRADKLMYEWMELFLWEYAKANEVKVVPVDRFATMKKKWLVKTINDLTRTLKDADADESAKTNEEVMHIAPPSAKDYINLLRAYSVSKAKRKGEQADALLANMMELANCLNGADNRNVDWIKESIPNSKMFALAVKCYAGSTHNEAKDRIDLLIAINDEFSQASKSIIPGLFINDPYVMLHSIKSLRNFHIKGEKEKAVEWLGKLHGFVINPNNKYYFAEDTSTKQIKSNSEDMTAGDSDESGSDDKSTSSTKQPGVSQIDVTSAYQTVIRLFARLRGEKGVAAEARAVLEKMNMVHDLMVNGLKHDNGHTADSIAFVDIRTNAYNLVLGMYMDSKLADDATNAVELLTRMIEAGRKEETDRNGVPLPTHQSFEFTILSLTKMTDSGAAIKEAERLIGLMEETDYLERSIIVYNALLSLCTKTLYGKPELFDKAMSILEKLNECSKTYPELAPNAETKSLIIKACAHSGRKGNETVLDTANKIFSELVAQEEDEKSAKVMTDTCYFHMMLCSTNIMTGDEETKKEHLEELFSQACQRGLCSNAVLTLFRNSTSEEEYQLTVGRGRLADKWIANVTSPKALYTDSSTKGAGKNARRHGKSTSGWAKKQKQKESQKKVNRDSKRVKKMLRKM